MPGVAFVVSRRLSAYSLTGMDPSFSSRVPERIACNRLTEARARLEVCGTPIIDLTVSNPTQVWLDYSSALRHPFDCVDGRDYHPESLGLGSAREAVAAYLRRHDLDVDSRRVVLTTSTSEAYGLLFKLLCDPGDEVMIPRPSYPLLEYLTCLESVVSVPYTLDLCTRWELDVSALCRQHGLALIVDEVFHDFRWERNDNRPGSFSADSPCLTFLLNGLSKIAACPQLKLGWIVTGGPAQLADEARRRLEILADTYLSVSTPIQLATEHVLSLAGEMQAALLRRIRRNLGSLDQALTGSALSRLEGRAGWYAVLRIPQLTTDEQLAIELIEQTGVHVHPGNLFGFNSGAHWVVSLISREEAFRNGVSRILEFWGRRG